MVTRDCVRLPEAVRARHPDLSGVASVMRSHLVEVRRTADFEIRESQSADDVRLVGYALTFDRPYPIFGGPERGGFMETVAPGCCDKTLREKDDVRLLVNHEGLPLARTRSGTMTLAADDVGLLVDATLDPLSPLVMTVRSAMDRGDLDQMSFAFEVVKQNWSPDWDERRILEVRLFDVSVVTFPANEDTLALVDSARSEVFPPPAGRSVELVRAEWGI